MNFTTYHVMQGLTSLSFDVFRSVVMPVDRLSMRIIHWTLDSMHFCISDAFAI